MGQVQCRRGTDVPPSLNHHTLSGDGGSRQVVVMPHRLADAVACDQVRDPNFLRRVWADLVVFHRLGNPLTEVANAANLLGFVWLKVPREDALLGVPNAVGFCDRNDFMDFVDVQVAPGPVVMLQQRGDGLVPTLKHALFAGVAGVEVDAALGPSDVRSGHREFDLHGLRQGLHLALIQPRTHPRATASRTPSQGVDHHPPFRLCFAVLPSKHNLRCAVFVRLQQVFHAVHFDAPRR